MNIDKHRSYISGNFLYRNFTTLTRYDLLMILKERNHPDVKKWMYTNEDIEESDHLNFAERLQNREDSFYWLMLYNDKPVGVLCLVHCNYEKQEADPGYYLFADSQNSGIGLEMHVAYKKLFFEQMGVEILSSHILYGNNSAMQLTLFFGGYTNGFEIIDGQKFVSVLTPKENFEKIETTKLTSKFIKFIKSNPIKWEEYAKQ